MTNNNSQVKYKLLSYAPNLSYTSDCMMAPKKYGGIINA